MTKPLGFQLNPQFEKREKEPARDKERLRLQPLRNDVKTKVDVSMRARQLVSTVRQGRKITISILDENPMTGYLCGWDDDTYFIICPNDNYDPIKMLIPKTAILFIELHDERTFREELDHEKMDQVVKPFKDLINNQYFSGNREN